MNIFSLYGIIKVFNDIVLLRIRTPNQPLKVKSSHITIESYKFQTFQTKTFTCSTSTSWSSYRFLSLTWKNKVCLGSVFWSIQKTRLNHASGGFLAWSSCMLFLNFSVISRFKWNKGFTSTWKPHFGSLNLWSYSLLQTDDCGNVDIDRLKYKVYSLVDNLVSWQLHDATLPSLTCFPSLFIVIAISKY